MKTKFWILFVLSLTSFPTFAGNLNCGEWESKFDEMGESRQCTFNGTSFDAALKAFGKQKGGLNLLKNFPTKNTTKTFKKGVFAEVEWHSENEVSVLECYEPNSDNCSDATFKRHGKKILIKQYAY